MKKCFLLLLLLIGGMVCKLSAKPEIRLIHSAIVCDTVTDAVSPHGMAVNEAGDYLVTFMDMGDIGPGSKTYLTISRDHGKSWSKPQVILQPERETQGVCGMICNIPGSRNMLMIVNTFDYDSTSANPYEWKSRSSKLQLFSTTDGVTLKPFAELKQPQRAVISSMGSLTRLANGDLVLPAYCYRGKGFPVEPEASYGCGWYRSSDNGKTWGDFEVVFKDEIKNGFGTIAFTESAFAVRDDGSITGFVRTDRSEPRRQHMAISRDHGRTWSDPVDAGRLIVYFPLMAKLADNEGFLMVGGWRQAYRNCVSMLYSKDGNDFELIGQAAYHPDNKPTPMNSATGGIQAMVPGPKKHQYYVVFYAHDPKLPGRYQTRLEGNMFEFVPDKQK